MGLRDAGITLFTCLQYYHCHKKRTNDNVESCQVVFLLFFSCCINEFSLVNSTVLLRVILQKENLLCTISELQLL